MSDTTGRSGRASANAIALLSLAVAVWAVVQSCGATRASHDAQEKANKLQEESVTIQQETFDREQNTLAIKDIQVQLVSADDADVILYPKTDAKWDQFEPIPAEVWRSHPYKYVLFAVENRGGDSVYADMFGIQSDDETWISEGETSCLEWCPDGSGDADQPSWSWSRSCSVEIPPKDERWFIFQLTDDLLNRVVDRKSYSQGIKVCAIMKVGQVCETGQTDLPQAAFRGPAPLK
jgi:hypothetical protein